MATTDADNTHERRKEAYHKVLGVVEHNTGGKQPAMVSRTTVRQIASTSGFSASESKTAIRAAVENGDLITWHGKLFRTDEPSLLAILETERESDTPRRGLIARCNKALAEVRDD